MAAIVLEAIGPVEEDQPWLESATVRGFVKPQFIVLDGVPWLYVSVPVKPGELLKLRGAWRPTTNHPPIHVRKHP